MDRIELMTHANQYYNGMLRTTSLCCGSLAYSSFLIVLWGRDSRHLPMKKAISLLFQKDNSGDTPFLS